MTFWLILCNLLYLFNGTSFSYGLFNIEIWFICKCLIVIIILFTNPSARAGYDTRSIFKRSLTGLSSEFSFSETSCLIKAGEISLPYYLPIAGGRIIGLIPFPRVLVLCEMQTFSSRIWTRVAMSISYDDNHYTTGTSCYHNYIFKVQFMFLYCTLFVYNHMFAERERNIWNHLTNINDLEVIIWFEATNNNNPQWTIITSIYIICIQFNWFKYSFLIQCILIQYNKPHGGVGLAFHHPVVWAPLLLLTPGRVSIS